MVLTKRPRREGYLYACALMVLFQFSGCAVLAPKSNDQVLSKISGADVVISVPSTTIDLDRISPVVKKDQSVFRLVSENDYPAAVRSNGNKLSAPVTLADPSLSMTNALARYYQKTYQLRFVAKGTISNIDPIFIQQALTKGDFVLDVRLTELSLKADANQQFYPQGAFMLSIIDRKRGTNRLQDTCRFAAPQQADTMRTYTRNNGEKINAILKTYANHCLQYFAKGTPLPTNSRVAERTVVRNNDRVTNAKIARFQLGGDVTYYPQTQLGDMTLTGVEASTVFGNRLSPTLAWRVRPSVKASSRDGLPTLSDETLLSAALTVGAEYYPSGDNKTAVSVGLMGQTGQTRLKGVLLSTNALGLELGASQHLFWKLRAEAAYTYVQHIGLTEESNVDGHSLRLSLGYEF